MQKNLLTALAFVLTFGTTGMLAEPQVPELTSEQLERILFAVAADDCDIALPKTGDGNLFRVSSCPESDCIDVSDCIAECPSGNNPACVDGTCEYDYSPPSPPSGGRCWEADCLYNSDCFEHCTTSSPQCVNNLCIP